MLLKKEEVLMLFAFDLCLFKLKTVAALKKANVFLPTANHSSRTSSKMLKCKRCRVFNNQARLHFLVL